MIAASSRRVESDSRRRLNRIRFVFRSISTKNHRGDEQSSARDEAKPAGPIAEFGIKRRAVVERDRPSQRLHRLLWYFRLDHSVSVDKRRDTEIDRSRDRRSIFDRPEHADRQMHVVLLGPVKPAVVRLIDHEIRVARGRFGEKSPSRMRQRIFKTNPYRESIIFKM